MLIWRGCLLGSIKLGVCRFVAGKTRGCQLQKKKRGGGLEFRSWYPISKRQCPPPPGLGCDFVFLLRIRTEDPELRL